CGGDDHVADGARRELHVVRWAVFGRWAAECVAAPSSRSGTAVAPRPIPCPWPPTAPPVLRRLPCRRSAVLPCYRWLSSGREWFSCVPAQDGSPARELHTRARLLPARGRSRRDRP